MKMYGNTEAAEKIHLVPVKRLARAQSGTDQTHLGHADQRRKQHLAVAQELVAYPHLRPYVTDIGGLLTGVRSWTQRMDSFGIAIDLNTRRSEYWKWDHKDNWQLDS